MDIFSSNGRPIELEASICIADTLMILCYYKQFQYTRVRNVLGCVICAQNFIEFQKIVTELCSFMYL